MTRIGTSDLDVSSLCLGGNTFGWTSDRDTSFAVLDAYTAAGGNFIDTADVYSAFAPGNVGGESETVLGEWFTTTGRREDVVLATKVGQHPEFRGLGADNIARAADASLQRLETDHIDLYYAHRDDPDTALEETAAAFNALVQAGKVRHVGLSNYSAERIREWMAIADENGFARPIALQPHYNLVKRHEFETELAPVATQFDLGVMPYFALASGFLSGKYRSKDDFDDSARSGFASAYLNDESVKVLEVADEIAEARDVTMPTVAIAWLLTKPTVVAPIASARVTEQLEALLAAMRLELSADDLDRLDAESARIPA
ncbi:aldo/keto reductase [Frigoribacterium sp. PhB116]|uniref:aldo/keto reductase n=1 Tax=Frigoribacterium sp. PhB116 TaxID=2485174 RepID=UPI00105D2F65|nr:aldo/keto reductase [Frigoribacterium sp. PhB116]TDT66474.1 aryl-alcohol dehydrogenase-like predicted oxidoreductase [Frigoribacterium sp. PhB116]